MLTLSKIIHVLALSIWFGTAIFFLIVGWSLFHTFEDLTTSDPSWWLPIPAPFQKPPPSNTFSDPLSKELGNRLAGRAVQPLFTWYFCLQTVCAVMVLGTALIWLVRHRQTPHLVRALVLVLAAISLMIGWWQEQKVSDLRERREKATDHVLQSKTFSQGSLTAADAVRSEFSREHGYSMMINAVTILWVLIGTILTIYLPSANVLNQKARHFG